MRYFLLILALATAGALPAADAVNGRNMPVADFLEELRHPALEECWAIMTGIVEYRRRGEAAVEYPLELRARFSPARSLLQLIFNNNEWYSISQDFGAGLQGSVVLNDRHAPEGQPTLTDFGIRPGDLTMSFLYWDFVDELPDDGVKGLHCRVLRLKHPEADEFVKIWASSTYFFPLKVQWLRGQDSTDPYRELVFRGTEDTEIGTLAKEVVIQDRGWRTRVRFDTYKVGLIRPGTDVPHDLFRQPPTGDGNGWVPKDPQP